MTLPTRHALLACVLATQFCSLAFAQGGFQADRDVASYGARTYDQADDRTQWTMIAAGSSLPTGASVGQFGVVSKTGSVFSSADTTPALAPISALSVGADHFAAIIKQTGAVTCWGGSNSAGQCNTPPTLGSCSSVAAGRFFTLAVRTNGEVVGWGSNLDGQTTPPATLLATQVAAGSNHALAVNALGAVVAWGNNNSGQTTVPAGASANVTQVAAGPYASAALLSEGVMACHGAARKGGVEGCTKEGAAV
jgi:alpha-tubulin suppressor-like RCC1 family protein